LVILKAMSDYIVRDLLEKTMQNIKAGIERNMTNLRRNASGESVRSLRYTIDGDLHAQLEGNISFLWMERGRKRGKIPIGFHKIILQWIHDKGLSVSDKRDRDAAWLIAKHIRDNGTKLNREGGFDDIYTGVINTNVSELYRKLDWWLDNMVTDVMKK